MSFLSELRCRAMSPEDLPQVLALQHLCYQPEFHEPLDAFESKLQAAPDTCWVISNEPASVLAYLVSLPVAGENYPLLHARQWEAAAQADELYLHDMAISPALRGRGGSHKLLQRAIAQAQGLRLPRLSLIAVQNSASFWMRQGFSARQPTSSQVAHKLASFGSDAMLMSHTLAHNPGQS
jgi:GNAT superfamily N-acetyltransferase